MLHARALVQGHGEGGVPPAVADGDHAVLIGGHGRHDAPVEPRRLAALVARVHVALAVRVVFLEESEIGF